MAFCRSYLVHGEAHLAELHLGAIGQQRVRVVGLGRPLRAIDRRPLSPLGLGDLLDNLADADRCVHRHLLVFYQAENAVEVIRMSMRHHDRQQRLLQRAEPGTQCLDVGDQQIGVDHHHA
jgi:hypothetical protein